MNSESQSFSNAGDPSRFSEQFLEELALDLVLEARTETQVFTDADVHEQPALRELLAHEEFVARVTELRSWVGETRDSLETWRGQEDEVASTLAPKILESSTRSTESESSALQSTMPPNGLWGDAKILVGFMKRRMASSVALRLAAASLIAHLIALPALAAYIYWQRPEAKLPTIRFDVSQPVLPDEPIGDAPYETLETDSDLWSALGLDEANAIAQAHYRLSHQDWSGAASKLQEPTNSWVESRLQRLKAAESLEAVTALPTGLPASFGHVLALDLALDDWLLGRSPKVFGDAWFKPLEQLVSGSQTDGDPLVQLALATLSRAVTYGLLSYQSLVPEVQSRLDGLDPAEKVLGPWWFALLGGLETGPRDDLAVWTAWFDSQH